MFVFVIHANGTVCIRNTTAFFVRSKQPLPKRKQRKQQKSPVATIPRTLQFSKKVPASATLSSLLPLTDVSDISDASDASDASNAFDSASDIACWSDSAELSSHAQGVHSAQHGHVTGKRKAEQPLAPLSSSLSPLSPLSPSSSPSSLSLSLLSSLPMPPPMPPPMALIEDIEDVEDIESVEDIDEFKDNSNDSNVKHKTIASQTIVPQPKHIHNTLTRLIDAVYK